MSHVHNVAGQSNAAAEYHAYLEALRAARQARENERAQGGGAVRTFDSAIDADQEGAQEEPEEPAQDEGAAGPPPDEPAEPGLEPPPAAGLGPHYA